MRGRSPEQPSTYLVPPPTCGGCVSGSGTRRSKGVARCRAALLPAAVRALRARRRTQARYDSRSPPS
ncbi:unnamed protein product, partial [Iphiclides podalirius]